MLDKIKPGSRVSIKIVKQPTNVAASKTLVRVLGKDAKVREANNRIHKVRRSNYNPTPRGGRLYGGRMVKLRPIKGQIGESGTVTATCDVLADLRSVQRFIEVAPA